MYYIIIKIYYIII